MKGSFGMKSWLGFSSVIAATLLLGGCNGSNDTAPTAGGTPGKAATPAPSKGGDDFKVALLTPGPVSDAGWNALAYSGLQAVQKELGAKVENEEAADTKIKDALRSYAQQGYKLVFGHGFEYNKPASEVAKDFPGTVFVTSSGGLTAPNVGAFRFYLEQGFYLAGMLAGKMSKGTIAEIGGIGGIPSIESTFKAFEAGAKSVNPKIVVIKIYSGDFTDVAKAQSATEQAIAKGADFVIHQANNAAQGVFNACKAHNVYAFGSNADQNSVEADTIIASATIVADPAFVEVAKSVKDGTFKGSVVLFGMDKGAVDFVLNPKLKDKVPMDVQKLLTDTAADIKSGKLVVPKDNF
jgi:basic membrane lipoprotein Med (substrate-binding protein (PBP1-ABC) superfamily)